jgi:hypothetical protein
MGFLITGCGGGSSSSSGDNAAVTSLALNAVTESGRVTRSWDNAVAPRYNAGAVGHKAAATRYNLYYARKPDCDVDDYARCGGGVMVASNTFAAILFLVAGFTCSEEQ